MYAIRSYYGSKIENGEIKRVQLSASYFVGYDSPSPSGSGSEGTPGSADQVMNLFSSPAARGKTWRTVGLLSEEFLDFLNERGVEYSMQAEQSNFLVDS